MKMTMLSPIEEANGRRAAFRRALRGKRLVRDIKAYLAEHGHTPNDLCTKKQREAFILVLRELDRLASQHASLDGPRHFILRVADCKA
jgi:hypothetical protein